MTNGWIDVDSPSIHPSAPFSPTARLPAPDHRRLGKGRLRLEPGRARSDAVLPSSPQPPPTPLPVQGVQTARRRHVRMTAAAAVAVVQRTCTACLLAYT